MAHYPQKMYLSAVDKRLRTPIDEIEASVCGSINEPEKFLLNLILKKIDDAQSDINSILANMQSLTSSFENELSIIDSIPGIDKVAALTILGEIGNTPNTSFDSSEKLVSWAGLSPRNDESAGKIKSRKTLHGNPYIKSILCQVAWSAVRSRNSHFHNWFWSHQGKLGRKKAIIAVARKILKLIFKLLSCNELYDPEKAMLVA